ncbi:MAG TPA: extracellular solute-binding protein, partial [Terriglobia bacterium]|nr:extracellular solute-binding protein [Terriglobia bacterium]
GPGLRIARSSIPATMRRNATSAGKHGMRFAKLRILTAVTVLGLIATACGDPAKKETDGKGDGQSLIIYTGRDKDEVARVVELFIEKNPKYKGKVDTLTLGAQAALERLKAEKDNPQAGFLWGGTQQGLQQAAAANLLAPSNPTNAGLIDGSRKDKDGRWYAEMLLPEVIIYNHDLLKPDQAPKDWDDLITPAFKDKIVIRDVMPSGTMRTIYSAMMVRQNAITGSPDAGYAWLKKLDANTVSYTPTPDDMYFNLDRGVGTVTLWNLQDALIQPLKNNRPWSYVIPASGVPVLLDGVGVVNNPKAMQAGLDFENFLLEPELQLQLAKDYYQIPAMNLPEANKPEWLAKLNIKEMKIDWDAMSAKQTEWMDHWAQNIKGKSGK